MRIRKVELQGFKSFVDRQSFHFGDGIAGVVGPNGCGKSNISDAIRWCIGEMSAKSLRGSEMQDVIFNGTTDRKPVGFAEVSMSFLADGEPFPGQWARYEEILVTRRLYRTGKSEYLINQEKVRRRDVLDLFLDTGIANPLYSFIEQGRVEHLISSKPEKRRELIEEAAGISRYKVRRTEALSKLDKTEQNLARTTDLTDEMAKRLRSLERQVQKAAKYRRLRAWVRQGELYLSLAKFNGLTGDRKALFVQLRQAKQGVETESREVLRKEKELGQDREELLVVEAVVGGFRDEVSELEALRREQESARHYQGRERKELVLRQQSLVEALQRIAEQGEQANVELGSLSRDLNAAQDSLDQQEGRIAQREGDAGTRIERLDAHRSHERTLDARRLRLASEVASKSAKVQAIENRGLSFDDRLADLAQEDSAADQVLKDLVLVLAEASQAMEEAERQSAEKAKAVAACSARLVTAQAQREQSQQDLSQVRKQSGVIDLEVARAESRLQSLEELQDSHAGVSEGAKRFLEHGKSLGSLAEHLDVPPEQELAIQSLLGPVLDLVLVANDQDLASMLQDVGEGALAGLLSLENAPAPSELAKGIQASESGAAALALLLKDWQSEDSLVAAIEKARKGQSVWLQQSQRVLPGGVVWVGQSSVDASTAVLRRRHQITELKLSLEGIRAQQAASIQALDKAEKCFAEAREKQASIRQMQETLRGQARQAELAENQARHDRLVQEKEQARRQDSHTSLGEKIARIHRQQLDCRGELSKLSAELLELTAVSNSAQSALEQHRLQGQAIEGAAAQAREALTRIQAERKGAKDRLVLLGGALDSVKTRQKEMDERAGTLKAEQSAGSKRIEELQADDLCLGESIGELESRQAVLRDKLGLEGQRLQDARERMAQLEEHLRNLRNQCEKARSESSRIEMVLQEVRVRIETVRDQVQQRYSLSLAALLDQIDRDGHLVLEAGEQASADLPIDESKLPDVQDFPVRLSMLENESLVTEWVERVEDSRRKVEMLGEVNLAALEEFVELRARHVYLEEQRADLEDSVAAIRKAIAQINRTCRERFRDAYDKVNANFQSLYPRLVGGGSARLQLTNEDDLLETGVEILAQPPGKRLQNLTLLSGGEKAMTALALIFSLFQVKPSPFCLLDEVDAPLDESNGARFNQMLREMSKTSQFIVITHNKKTMEVMDTLYGVTMPKPGQSRLVSVQIH
jgi:chromosome segregation protein